jgi:hypothetical protein
MIFEEQCYVGGRNNTHFNSINRKLYLATHYNYQIDT